MLEFELALLRTDRLSLLFGYLFHIAAFIAVIFALHVRDTTQHVAGLLYAGSALGAVFAGDLITLFIFWELLAISSVFLIWARRTERAMPGGHALPDLPGRFRRAAAGRCAAALPADRLAGLRLHRPGRASAGWLIFLAFGIKCAFPLLHNWLTDAYPEATPTGTVFLSAFTTKVAVYALARGFPGTELLVYIGAVMTCFPIFYAVIENDLRRVLAYSMINQIGFMVCGIGIGTALALNGAVAHAFNDVIFKGLLFMTHGRGAVPHRQDQRLRPGRPVQVHAEDGHALHRRCRVDLRVPAVQRLRQQVDGHELPCSRKAMTCSGWCCCLPRPACSIMPASRSRTSPSSPTTRASAPRKRRATCCSPWALAAVLCIFIGSQPQYLYALLPWEVDYWPYDTTHVLSQLQLLFFSALAFVWLNKQGLYPPELHAVNIDAEWLYRKLLPAGGRFVYGALQRTTQVLAGVKQFYRRHVLSAYCRTSLADYHLAESWPTGSMVLWIAVVLGSYLLLDSMF